ncbi:hypothetical protein ACOSP6_11910 [Tenacibaculum sp. MEBiC06402]|uniref:hypothetical protein n=1 Tax=unclassified Tenacibaculum TaxID=2635139 RepID=UPI003B9D8B7D
MVIEEFKRLSELYNGELYINDETLTTYNGGKDFFYTLFLRVHYKGRAIDIKNTTGAPVGSVTCNFDKQKDDLNFSMHTRDVFISLFFKGSRFKFKNSSPNINRFFRNSNSFTQLKEIAKTTAFEPSIIGEHQNNNYQLKFLYSLKFDNWSQVIEPILNFYKEFIDEFIPDSNF